MGEYYHKEHQISFPCIDMPRRTDETFRNKTDSDHHKIDISLEKLPIDMIKSIPVSDSLHLLDLGIIKRLLTGYPDNTHV